MADFSFGFEGSFLLLNGQKHLRLVPEDLISTVVRLFEDTNVLGFAEGSLLLLNSQTTSSQYQKTL